jgi:lysine 6-dehydrogenase
MKAAVIGCGMIGKAAAYDLVQNPEVTEVKIIDPDKRRILHLNAWLGSEKVKMGFADASDMESCRRQLSGYDAALSCVPYRYNHGLAKAAIAEKVHLLDLGGNNDVVAQELKLDKQAKRAGVLVVPDCGLAPGLVSVLTKKLYEEFDELRSVHLRVGGLPQEPQPPLDYALVFSVTGLINEYVEPCTRLRYKKIDIGEPLGDLEKIAFPEPYNTLEAFNTSGGSSTLPQTYTGKIANLDYKTIRYRGHRDKIKLLFDLGLADSQPFRKGSDLSAREVLEAKLSESLPKDQKDAILLRARGEGIYKGTLATVTYQMIDTYDSQTGLTAMMRTTAFPATVLMGLIGSGEIKERGALTQEHFVPAQKIIDGLTQRGIKIKRHVIRIDV